MQETTQLRVLVVDDDPAFVKTLGWMVELLGHDVKTARDAPEALTIAKEFLPRVALIDIGLKGSVDGYALARLIRQEPSLEGCMLVAQTGWGLQEHKERTAQAGFAHHLLKPVTIEMLEELFATL